ncbi:MULTISPECIES: GNAT family N-acetyltransferase [unclassified Streptomyces]|uniref:GNAT family N-acetyltransferase n=1 Tax=unclassified Streptomyces TaxID=2593676 RepID=UPI002E8052EA|nr:GNAT family N-acetyltransferase [Streptomyces sp. NBC_00589]WTI40656.1 GNAT family N-acetyltransferase [Streptomyces sp. NBC_00775]WUB25659.1 GNAT family N-acetyltransferase [Streptomyces sp. NBC_00589]
MTTTLRPTEPLQHAADGALSRRYQVCVNSRPVGGIHLSTHPEYGPTVARIAELFIEEPDRGRGRGTVAVLAAEEVVRGWGCRRIETSVPGDAEPALRLATTLGYVVSNRNMAKQLDGSVADLPVGSVVRPMTEAEFVPWLANQREAFARVLIELGVPEDEAYSKTDQGHAKFLPDGLASENTFMSVLEHDGVPVGVLWVGLWPDMAFVLDVEADAEHRGHGHGRTLMLVAEAQAVAAGRNRIGLNVYAGNTPAERLYESLGYETTMYHLYKNLP